MAKLDSTIIYGSLTTNGNLLVSEGVKAFSFIKTGGTAAQFLKADGSVDSNTYLTSYTNTTYTSSNGILLTGTNFTPTYGTATNTIAQGNDSRINNGQTAFGWGNHASAGYVTTDTNTTYTAGTGLSLSGTVFNNTAPDQTVTLTGGGATSITGTYPNFTISSTDTNTDTNTTYTGGSGITLTGTVFSATYGTAAGTVAQGNDSRINNGQTAFGWGNHASGGYLTSETDTLQSVTARGTTTSTLSGFLGGSYGVNYGAVSGAPNSTVWSISPTYTDYGIFYENLTNDRIIFKNAGIESTHIELGTGKIVTKGGFIYTGKTADDVLLGDGTTTSLAGISGGGGTTVDTTNIALGKVPSGSSITNQTYATDGVLATGNYTTFGTGNQNLSGTQTDYIQIDLQFAADVLEHRVFFYDLDGRSYYYNMTYSTDGTNWTHAVGTAGNFILSDGVTDVPDTINLGSPITARYWRIFGNGNTVNTANHLYEWEIYEGTGGSTFNGGIITGDITIQKTTPTLRFEDTASSSPANQSGNIRFEALDVNLPDSEGMAFIFETTDGTGTDLTPSLITTGNFYAESNKKVATQAWVTAQGYGTGGGGTTYSAGTDLTLAGSTFNVTSSTAGTGNTIAKRDSNGYLTAAIFRSDYDVTNPTIGYIMTQVDTVSNNYLRPSTPAQFRAAVTDGSYPSNTGTGASGTWGISISGNASTASTATTSNLIKVNDYNSTTIMRLLGSHQWGGSDNVYSTAGVTMNCSSNAITASGGFYETSLRKFKTNITPFTLSGLDLINELDIVTFDRNDSEVKNKIGIIADDSPKEFLSNEEDAVDLYKTIFVQTKAIQELNNKVDNQQKQINELKELVTKLINK